MAVLLPPGPQNELPARFVFFFYFYFFLSHLFFNHRIYSFYPWLFNVTLLLVFFLTVVFQAFLQCTLSRSSFLWLQFVRITGTQCSYNQTTLTGRLSRIVILKRVFCHVCVVKCLYIAWKSTPSLWFYFALLCSARLWIPSGRTFPLPWPVSLIAACRFCFSPSHTR